MRTAWDLHAGEWISWARAPGHDSYWRFHREAFLPLVPPPEWLARLFEAGIRAHPQDWHMLQRVFVADLDPARLAAAESVAGTGRNDGRS
jgi:hypothetical protein